MSEDNSSSGAEDTTEQNSADNKKTILYAMTREALRAEDLTAIRDALDDEGYTLKPSEDGENIMIQRDKDTGTGVDVSDVLGQ